VLTSTSLLPGLNPVEKIWAGIKETVGQTECHEHIYYTLKQMFMKENRYCQ